MKASPPMQWINDRRSYGWLSIALHWLAAVAVGLMLWTGLNADFAEEAHNQELHRSLIGLHISLGASFALVLLARVLASYAQAKPEKPPQAALLNFASSATQQLMLLAILAQIISGPLIVWSGARPINVFSLFSIPSPFAQRNPDLREALELVHNIGRWTLEIVIPLHILGALKHAMLDRDGVLQRMLIAGKTL
jgi:cytochrome b561